MRYSKIFVHSALLFTVPPFVLSPQANVYASTGAFQEKNPEILPAQAQGTPLGISLDASLLSYDDILHFLEELENGELEKRCTPADLEQINHFLISLARQGLLSDDAEEQQILENDIQELLHGEDGEDGEDDPYEYTLSFGHGGDYVLIPGGALHTQEGIILCKKKKKKGLCHKLWDHTKDFVKKNKKEVIIGAIVVVGAALIIGAVVAASAAATAAAAGAAGAATSSDSNKSDKEEQKGESSSALSIPTDTSPAIAATDETPILKSIIDNQISNFKKNIVKGQFFQSTDPATPNQGLSWEENGRALGSLFAHDSLNNLNIQIPCHPRLAQEIQDIESKYSFSTSGGNNADSIGHPEIDRKFSTDYTRLYVNPGQEVDFNTLSHQVRGERALAFGYYSQAINDFGKAIEHNPTNSILYLERSASYFNMGQYDHFLEDFHAFTSQAPKTYPFSVTEFSLGFAKGLPKGAYESGEGILLLLADFVTHPIHTSVQMVEALTTLANLACTDEWGVIAEALAPEIHQLATQWNTIPSDERGELAGYALGKHGADILIPGALVKVASKSVQSAQALVSICKILQRAESTLILETAAGLGKSATVAEVIEAGRQTAFIAEELGYSGPQIGQLKQAGKLEATVANTFETTFKKAETFLKSYSGEYLSETRAKELIHQTGIRTFPKPDGIPENFRIKLSDKGAGIRYIHPENEHISIRVMPGKPHSPNLHQQKPYIIQMKDGQALDKYGNLVNRSSPEAHIPIEEFVYRSN